VRDATINDLTQVWLGHGGIERSIAHFLYGIPRWKRKKVKPSTAKRVNLVTELGLNSNLTNLNFSQNY